MHPSWIAIFVFILVTVIVIPATADTGYGKYSSRNQEHQDAKSKQSSRGITLSAWGIVFLVIAAILIGIFGYYAAIFYPLICKKERKYDRIELSTV